MCFILGSIIGATKRDAGNLDYHSYGLLSRAKQVLRITQQILAKRLQIDKVAAVG